MTMTELPTRPVQACFVADAGCAPDRPPPLVACAPDRWPEIKMRARLADGARITIVPLRPEGREVLREAFSALSARTRYLRFQSGTATLSEAQLTGLVDDVDGHDHVAFVAWGGRPGEPKQPVAVGRLVRYRNRPDEADVSVTVEDHWQGRGVAGVLLRALLRHRHPGVRRIVTVIAGDNPASERMLARLGPMEMSAPEWGVRDVTVHLTDEPDRAPGLVGRRPDLTPDAERQPGVDSWEAGRPSQRRVTGLNCMQALDRHEIHERTRGALSC